MEKLVDFDEEPSLTENFTQSDTSDEAAQFPFSISVQPFITENSTQSGISVLLLLYITV